MKHSSGFRRAAAAALLAAAIALVATATAGAAQGSTTLTLKEPENGSTFTFIDNAPTSKKTHGFPTKISPGDEIAITNPLTEGGKTVGKLRARCTATAGAKTTSGAGSDPFAAAHFICEGVFSLGGNRLYGNATIVKGGTEGAITGGTGKYAGARGTFVSKEGKGASTTTITLLE
ncbi:MAG TPA: hypothetical protein VGI73_08455 [Solirubrobacterales bacterium]|jgi:hypothetical protein